MATADATSVNTSATNQAGEQTETELFDDALAKLSPRETAALIIVLESDPLVKIEYNRLMRGRHGLRLVGGHDYP